ncbi:M14-type cytosolic carboxypeptidase [Niveibacterium sp. 24ML]|uniref:M14 family metallopeptidase n=1 Tax=Niveibacterium sp. 24ML TaxID=2985512 RepID=UPI002271D2EF|nr:M14-type cytosolic carboxypeptidase [Niveibacterium sp. 24ML]MCX9155117.1 M14-type cytosolic carboxypeptidase [Niveibacterium sp. 24ML]
MTLEISSQFDSGAIEIVDASDPSNVRLRIRDDHGSTEFRQWFHFRISGAAGQPLVLRFENAGECSYPEGWRDYRAVASYDRDDWFRLPDCDYDGAVLTVRMTPQRDALWLAYFEPYSQERHLRLLGRAASAPGVRVKRLGSSLQGRDIDLIEIDAPQAALPSVWVVARQHPGETMAEWFAEGLLEALLDAACPIARAIRQRAVVRIVTNINPDGAFLGNLRSNAAGVNLNREWLTPSVDRSPEILCVQQAMEETGVDLFLDIHGDETLPYVFIDGSHMVPGYGARNVEYQKQFLADLAAASPDFQQRHGYADDRFEHELLTLGSKWVAHRFGCVSLTLEMPFKDNADMPDPRHGWSAARSKHLGAAMLRPVLQHLRRVELR